MPPRTDPRSTLNELTQEFKVLLDNAALQAIPDFWIAASARLNDQTLLPRHLKGEVIVPQKNALTISATEQEEIFRRLYTISEYPTDNCLNIISSKAFSNYLARQNDLAELNKFRNAIRYTLSASDEIKWALKTRIGSAQRSRYSDFRNTLRFPQSNIDAFLADPLLEQCITRNSDLVEISLDEQWQIFHVAVQRHEYSLIEMLWRSNVNIRSMLQGMNVFVNTYKAELPLQWQLLFLKTFFLHFKRQCHPIFHEIFQGVLLYNPIIKNHLLNNIFDFNVDFHLDALLCFVHNEEYSQGNRKYIMSYVNSMMKLGLCAELSLDSRFQYFKQAFFANVSTEAKIKLRIYFLLYELYPYIQNPEITSNYQTLKICRNYLQMPQVLVRIDPYNLNRLEELINNEIYNDELFNTHEFTQICSVISEQAFQIVAEQAQTLAQQTPVISSHHFRPQYSSYLSDASESEFTLDSLSIAAVPDLGALVSRLGDSVSFGSPS